MFIKRLGAIPPQYHSISDICALELIEAQDTCFFGQVCGHELYGVQVVAMLHLHDMQPMVHVLHEIMEMDPRFRADVMRQGVVEHVHQHRLPAPDIAVHVKSSR